MKLKSMKSTISLALGVLLLCAAFTQTARADETRDAKIKAEMVENYLLWQEALKIQDAERIISFESPDFTSIHNDRTVHSKSESDVELRKQMKDIQKVHVARVTIKKLTIEPNRVVILSNKHYDVDLETSNDNLHRISVTVVSRDIWVQYDGAWMLKRSEFVSGSGTLDGVPTPT